ncbi:MAG TPA: 2-oxo-4-hydroxy-4-carboxy-5-ureidoimidazoline decarboxylase [Candidatus Limnocylindrales bacterium]|nr:2-oxo-4-hydroxy-4-carboxy-5-ureidoimidazoline decarboxylase [Candidatus Limnocylindrales bacterium]
MVAAVTGDRIAAAFERAPALLARLGAPFASIDETIAAARAALVAMSEDERIAVLAAHPRIGADPATLSASSRLEQGGVDDPAVLTELARLNAEYERRHGFRFVVFVNGRPKGALLQELRERLERPREAELATGLEELLAIARDRLERRR